MEKVNVTRRWGMAAALLGVVVCLAAVGVLVLYNGPPTAMAQSTSMPPVSIQWQPQSTLEKLAVAKILEDDKFLKSELDKLAKRTNPPDKPYKDAWKEKFKKTHLNNPRYWTGTEWKTGWDDILEPMHAKIKGSHGITIDAISGIIEYKERGNQGSDTEIDAVIKITVTFSASPGGNILEGELIHRRVCTWG
ncbi:MAG: hypothetical protein HGA24_00780 [Candidatus Aminicenantes bacterium]|nr:hypothetical protein [Candidatus Aminicenantes bacterium]